MCRCSVGGLLLATSGAAPAAEQVLHEMPDLSDDVRRWLVLVRLPEDDQVGDEDCQQRRRVVADCGWMRRAPQDRAEHAQARVPYRGDEGQIPVELGASGELPELGEESNCGGGCAAVFAIHAGLLQVPLFSFPGDRLCCWPADPPLLLSCAHR